MLWRLSWLGFAWLLPVAAAILPDHFAGAQKQAQDPPPISDRSVWEEYGLEAVERAGYQQVTITAWRFKDPTGALGGFQWLRPEDSRASKLGELAAEFNNGAVIAFGNYVMRMDGGKPNPQQFEQLVGSLPRLDQSALPTLPGFVPQQNRIPNSERYILGPAALGKFIPQVPAAVAAFSMGAEAQLARYRMDGVETTLAVFSYPTPQIARQRVEEFQKQPGIIAKRTGSLVAVVPSPSDPNVAEKLLALVRHNLTITWSEPTGSPKPLDWGNALTSIFVLTGILLVFCLVAGIAVGGFRLLLRRLAGKRGEEDPMILLHIDR